MSTFSRSRVPRRAPRAAPATLLLGPRVPGPARLVPLSPAEFLEEFAKGEIPQEHVDGGAGAIARAWADAGGARLDGASDLAGRRRFVERPRHVTNSATGVTHSGNDLY